MNGGVAVVEGPTTVGDFKADKKTTHKKVTLAKVTAKNDPPESTRPKSLWTTDVDIVWDAAISPNIRGSSPFRSCYLLHLN